MLPSDVGIEMLAILSHEDAIRSVGPLSSEDVAVVVDFHWFTDCHLEAIFYMNSSRLRLDLRPPLTGKIFVWQHQRFSLNPAQHDILPHRQSQLSELTIRLHITTSLKSISQKQWLYHLTFKRSTIYNNVTWPLQSVIQIHKYVIFRHQLTDLSKTNRRSPAATVQRKASMQQIGLPISASN